ncbi:hypothetical protein BC936DRAFT_136593 [Jimgerdemannia flammicorona]|uniref:SAM domain-containing protein n=1 Tax=Jimgerdemannia flammicorona TaxID=994334 RepID=A0A433DJH5_9FUNG|nr:hypothetical protein BC936DRAFT_136593 [Jimgerdemannia flammicorona]
MEASRPSSDRPQSYRTLSLFPRANTLLENGITGEVLINLDHEALKDLSIRSVGKRMAILKAVYNLKVAHNIPILGGDYVPPCECERVRLYNSAPSVLFCLASSKISN